MADRLNQIDYPDYADVDKQYRSGYEVGKDQYSRNTMHDAGQFLARGDTKGARNAFYSRGDVDGGFKVQSHMDSQADRGIAAAERQRAAAARVAAIVANGAMLADTPEKWEGLYQGLTARGINVSKFRDFGTREAALAEAGMSAPYLERKDRLAKEAQPTYQMGETGAFNPKDGTIKPYAGGVATKKTERERLAEGAGLVRGSPEFNDYVLYGDKQDAYDFGKHGIGNKRDGTIAPYPASGAGSEASRESVKLEQDLRKEHASLSKDTRAIQEGVSRVEVGASRKGGAGDIALIYGFMKINDPNSVVRETEFDIAQNIGSLPDRWQTAVNGLLSGYQLPASVRDEIVATSKQLADAKLEEQRTIDERFTAIAGNAGLDPSRVILPYGKRTRGPQPKPLPEGGFPATAQPRPDARGNFPGAPRDQATPAKRGAPGDKKKIADDELLKRLGF